MSVETDIVFKKALTIFILVFMVIFSCIGYSIKDHESKHLMLDWQIICLLALWGLWVIGGGI